MSAENSIAWLKAADTPLIVENGPIPVPEADEIIIETKALAINPADFYIAKTGFLLKHYPVLLGMDCAGLVVSVGSNTGKSFKTGDRVLAMADTFFAPSQKKGAFQKYAAVKAITTGILPESISFVGGSTLPLGSFTAGVALFHKEHLALGLPSIPNAKKNGKTVLIWGGASSVGSNAIQLAVAAGYSVVATASESNFDLLLNLGADKVVDYRSETIVEDAGAALAGTDFVGTFIAAAKGDSFRQAAEITKAAKGVGHIASAPFFPEGFEADLKLSFTELSISNYTSETERIANEIFANFLPNALEANAIQVFPPPQVVGHGLNKIQEALDLGYAGVSAKKLVVEL